MRKKITFIILLVCQIYFAHSQPGTITVQDSSTMTMQRWRDTCFALLNLSSSAECHFVALCVRQGSAEKEKNCKSL
ncbi:MAG: hypothetical protein JST47_09095 [Bacteroidetes bacterium]|nr:hypothetical protein [Bacteroidota bacterium]MBS1973627.1 hypothetical protein [Bacteroidota bacterium]